jgi:hypothetical protein
MRDIRWLIAVVGIAAVVGLFLLFRPDDDGPKVPTATPTVSQEPTTEPTAEPTEEPTPEETASVDAVEIEVEEGRVQGPARIEVSQGDQVRIEVQADVADEVHVHTYDIMVDTVPGEKALVEFPADIVGVFEIELEDAGLPLTRLEVTP